MKYISLLALAVIIAAGAYMYLTTLNPGKGQQVQEFVENGINDLSPLELAENATDMLEETTEAMMGDDEQTIQKSGLTNESTSETEVANIGTPTEIMLVAGGCFWCVEADLEKLSGVSEVVSGYAEGSSDNPTYTDYSKNGHREVVEVTYNPDVVSFEQILIYAMKHMDPTDGDGSFYDRGEYYSPAFYYENEEEKVIIENLIADVDTNGPYDKKLAIDVVKQPTFWPAEEYHQDYYKGTLSSLKYKYYRNASGRDAFIKKYWGDDTGPTLSWHNQITTSMTTGFWKNYSKPDVSELKNTMDTLAFKVTQEEGTEPSFTSPYDKFWEDGIYVDILSGEPLYSSKDKFDSGTGWPSFVKPITSDAVTERIDKKLFSTRTEIRSAIADNHIGHVFSDGPSDRGGLRYCMNGVALKFVAKADMEAMGYGEYVHLFN